MDISELIRLIGGGESERVELKSAISKDLASKAVSLANTAGGFIILGVDDDRNIIGFLEKNPEQTISDLFSSIVPPLSFRLHKKEIEGKKILIVEVDKSDNLHSVGNVVYVRVGRNSRPLAISEMFEKGAEYLKIAFDELPAKEIGVKEIKKGYVQWFFQKRAEQRNLKEQIVSPEALIKIKAAKKTHTGLVPTHAGLLFFSELPERFISGAYAKLVEFENDDMRTYKDYKEFYGPIWKIVDDVYDYLLQTRLRRLGGLRKGVKRIEFTEYPPIALREAVTNALVHKNYFIPSEVRIYLFPDRLEVRNPGAIPSAVDLRVPEHVPRNPVLCEYMFGIGYIEKFGSGIALMRAECVRHPLVNLEIATRGDSTLVVFRKTKKTEFFDPRTQKVLSALAKPRRSSEVASMVGVSKPTVIRILNELVSLGIVAAEGEGRGRKYRLR